MRKSLTGFLYFKNVLGALRWFLTVESKDSFELEGFVQIHGINSILFNPRAEVV